LNKSDTIPSLPGKGGIRPKLVAPRGVLYRPITLDTKTYARFWPGPELAPFVEHFWTVRWNEPSPVSGEVLPHPSFQMVLEAGESRLAGVWKGRFVRTFHGEGRVLGTKFLPGGFRAFTGLRAASFTGRELPLFEVFGDAASLLATAALAEEDPVRAFAHVERFLLDRRPALDEATRTNLATVRRVVERAMGDREILRVEQLAAEAALGERSLQRLFDEYVGVSPKWVIQRYRLHEASERIAADALAGRATDGADLAAELGYADQAHFIRDFKKLVGRTPLDYARSVAEIAAPVADSSPRRQPVR
jgi:AraC-like DNA-binding protein